MSDEEANLRASLVATIGAQEALGRARAGLNEALGYDLHSAGWVAGEFKQGRTSVIRWDGGWREVEIAQLVGEAELVTFRFRDGRSALVNIQDLLDVQYETPEVF